jgi:hypothetical protein
MRCFQPLYGLVGVWLPLSPPAAQALNCASSRSRPNAAFAAICGHRTVYTRPGCQNFVAAARAAGSRSHVEMMTLGDRSVAMPSAIYLTDDRDVVAGEFADPQALTPGPRRAANSSGGSGIRPHCGSATRRTRRPSCSPWCCATCWPEKGEPPARVAMTHPANWCQFRRSVFAEVPRLAGVSDAVTITEPEAASTRPDTCLRLIAVASWPSTQRVATTRSNLRPSPCPDQHSLHRDKLDQVVDLATRTIVPDELAALPGARELCHYRQPHPTLNERTPGCGRLVSRVCRCSLCLDYLGGSRSL